MRERKGRKSPRKSKQHPTLLLGFRRIFFLSRVEKLKIILTRWLEIDKKNGEFYDVQIYMNFFMLEKKYL